MFTVTGRRSWCMASFILLTVAGFLAVASVSSTARAATATATERSNCGAPVPGRFSCFSIQRARSTANSLNAGARLTATPRGYGPADLKSAYALPASGTTATVAVIDAYDDPSAEADLAVYRSSYGLPACSTSNGCFRKVNQAGAAAPLPAANGGWAGEIALDLDMVSATCPSCHILLVEATDNSYNLFQAVGTAVSLGAHYVSMSWGGTENGTEGSYDGGLFNAPGVVYTASSGDTGYGTSYPATSAKVIAVGGTSLTRAANGRGWAESAWGSTNAAVGAGSGCSRSITKPAWQAGIDNSVCAARVSTDVSAVADPATGVAVYQTYGASGWAVYGGTSAAAPIIASVYALAGATGGAASTSYPYTHAASLNDVVTGANGNCAQRSLCTAGAGWDGPTGLGTPNGLAAFGAAAATSPAPSPAPAPVAAPGTTPAPGTGPAPAPAPPVSKPAPPVTSPTPPVANRVDLTNPGTRTSSTGTPVSLQLRATDSGRVPLRYGVRGLPAGFTVNANTGNISGAPRVPGTYRLTAIATDATGATAHAGFTWIVTRSKAAKVNGASHAPGFTKTTAIPAGRVAVLHYRLLVTNSDSSSHAREVFVVTVNGKVVQKFSNLNRSAGYIQHTLDLSRYSGTVRLGWLGRGTGSAATNFYISDVAVTLA